MNPDYGVQAVVRGWGWASFDFDPLYNPDIVIFGVLIAGIWQGSGLIMCIMLAGLRGIDDDIWKAARVDGIGTVKTYLVVIIPMMRPVFVTALVLIAAGIIKLYDLVVAQTSGGPGLASQVPAKYVYDYMFKAQNLGQGFAASTMMLLSVVIILIPWVYLQFRGNEACDNPDHRAARPQAYAPLFAQQHLHLRHAVAVQLLLPVAALRHGRHLAERDAGNQARQCL